VAARRMAPLVPLVVYHSDPGAAAAVRIEYRNAVKSGILDVVPPEVKLSWSKGKFYPTIADWSQFSAGAVRVGGLEKMSAMGRQWLFRDESCQTEVEKAAGRLPGIARAPGAPGGIFSVPELAALFNAQVLPAQLEHSTRRSYWGSWQQVLTWGLAHGIMNKLLPMGLEDIQALVMELMMVGLAASSIKNIMSCVESRHRMFGLTPPLVHAKAFARMCKAVASVTGTPARLRFPIGTHHIQQMLALTGMSRLERRAVLITCVGTAACSRVDEAAQIQLCDLLWDHDAGYHVSLKGSLAIRIIRRKQDSGRFGLYVRLPAGCLVEALRDFVLAMGLRTDPRCTKTAHRGARCIFCDPVWPRAVVGRTPGAGPGQLAGMSRQQVSGAVKVALESINSDPRHYSGISMRRGGITLAVQAKIAPAILHLQSGHGTATSSMGYVDPVDPRVLYQTGAAILGLGP
jgi:hypothetical protein